MSWLRESPASDCRSRRSPGRRTPGIWALVLAVLAVPLVSQAQLLGVELVTNGDAETGDISGWTMVFPDESFQVIPNRACPAPPPGGNNCFWGGEAFGGPGPATHQLRQEIDVSTMATEIDAGLRRSSFSGLGHSTVDTNADETRLVVEFRDAGGASVIESFDSGVLGSPNFWQSTADERTLPVGSREIWVSMIGFRPDGARTDTYLDAVSLILSETECSDGVDNDGDTAIDGADTGCTGPSDPSELDPEIECDDGIDNDGDGATDLADPECDDSLDDSEDPRLPFEATFTLDLAQIPPLSAIGTGVARFTGTLPAFDSIQIPALGTGISTSFTPPIATTGGTTTMIPLFIGARPQSGMLSGDPLSGLLLVTGSFGASLASVPLAVALTLNGTRGVGIGGPPIVDSVMNSVATDALSLRGNPWTTGTATVDTAAGSVLSRAGFAHGPLSNTSTPALTGGVLQLVTPMRIVRTFSFLGFPALTFDLSGFGVLEVRFIPEPSRLLLWATAAGAAWMLGRSARRRRRDPVSDR